MTRALQFLHDEVDNLVHVLLRTADVEVAVVVAGAEPERAAESVELDVELLEGHVAGTQLAEVAVGHFQVVVVGGAVVVVDVEAEEVVLGVLRGVEVAVFADGHHLHLFIEVDDLWADGVHLAAGDALGEG